MAPSFVRASVREMSGYAPGEQPGAGERVVKLNTNENPYPPGDRVLKAIRDVSEESLRLYPHPTAGAFRAAAAKLHGVTPDMVIAGNGSDDLLTIATRTFIPPGGRIAHPEPTYSLYPVLARLQDAQSVPVPWGPDWSLPTEALLATKADAIYLANPNAPSGTFVSPMKVSELAAAFPGALLVDEAYADFADDNCVGLLKQHDNVVITRTLSKAYSLAGLRFGYALARAEVVAEMMKVKDSYNCDAIAVAAATAALEDQEYVRANWKAIRNERQRLSAALTEMGWDVLDSHANFVLAAAPNGRGREAYEALKRKHILVRYFDKPGLADKIRITVGAAYQNDALLAGVREIQQATADDDEAAVVVAASGAAREREDEQYGSITKSTGRGGGPAGAAPAAADGAAGRQTNETKIELSLGLDGKGETSAHTGVGFFDHMLDLLGRHGLLDLEVHAEGDLHVDAHHTVEDVGIVLGQALEKALGDKRGIHRYGWAIVPMDESLAQVALDLSGRPAFVFHVQFTGPSIGTFPVELVEEFFKALATNAKMNLHVTVPYGSNNHHIAEAVFKATARALRQAVGIDPRSDAVPSTKGSLNG